MPHEAYHQALMLAEIVYKLQKENQQQKLTIRRMKDELDNTGFGSHQEVQAQLLKEAKQRGDDLQEQVLDLTEENNNHRAYADRQHEKLEARDEYIKGADYKIAKLKEQLMERANATKWVDTTKPLGDEYPKSPSILAQWKIIEDLRADKKINTRERNEANRTVAALKCLLAEAKQRIKSLEKQREQQLYEAYQTIDNHKHLIDKYRKRQQFVANKLLLAEQLTRLQDYIKNEE